MNTPAPGGASSSAPLIVSALLGVQDQQWLNALREAHFPAERNHLPAHLTLFHAISAEQEEPLTQRLRQEARGLLAELAPEFRPAQLPIRGLALWRYRGGPWEAVAEFRFHR